jgi:hypothetical protein
LQPSKSTGDEDPSSIIPIIIGVVVGCVFCLLFAALVARRRKKGPKSNPSSRETYDDLDYDMGTSAGGSEATYQDFTGIKAAGPVGPVGPKKPPAKPKAAAPTPAPAKPKAAAPKPVPSADSPSGGVYGALPREGASEPAGDVVYGTLGNNATMTEAKKPSQPEVVYSALPS